MNKIKIAAFYLPQFHAIPENNEWWGEGFTEWTNVKKARPLFIGHNQPRIPLDNNYYNLLKPEVFTRQVDMANKYGIDAFCFYHYWFSGKLLLEKPVENFLKRKELNKEFCLSWANEPWTRTWDGQNHNILMPQSYDDKNDIENHFKYLLPFFKDSRYIKLEGKPVFLLYRAGSITYLENMIDKWNEMAKVNGFDGIYFVETLTGFFKKKVSQKTDASVFFEPSYAESVTRPSRKKTKWRRIMNRIVRRIAKGKLVSYRRIWKYVLENENIDKCTWGGAFVDWDNSPRRKDDYMAMTGVSARAFKKYMAKLYIKAQNNDCPFIFINAWNEWGEGTYLEPDTVSKYRYLEAIRNIKSTCK